MFTIGQLICSNKKHFLRNEPNLAPIYFLLYLTTKHFNLACSDLMTPFINLIIASLKFSLISIILCGKKLPGFLKPIDIKKAHIAVSLILLVAETGIEPVTRGFSTL